MELLTLDTVVIIDLWRPDQTWRADAEMLLGLARGGEVDLAVSRHIDLDITDGDYLHRLRALFAEGVLKRIQGLVILGESSFDGGDRFGDQQIVDLELEMQGRYQEGSGPEPPGHADWLLMHAHAVHSRDVFITRDGKILRVHEQLQSVGVAVRAPSDYLAGGKPVTKPFE